MIVAYKLAIPVMAFLLAASNVGCGDNQSVSDQKMDAAQAKLSEEGVAQVGMPGITNFTEKRMVRKLYELRDSSIATFTYVPDMNGRLWHVCDSVGFGLPYGVQFTNPHRPLYPGYQDSQMADQPEPNGLFMPPTAEGTWVMCAGAKGALDPVYVEPRVIVSTHKLHTTGDWQE